MDTPKSKSGLVISEDVIIKMAANAAMETPGVAAVTGGPAGIDRLGGLLKKESSFSAVRISVVNDGVMVDISISVVYGGNIQEIAANVQKSVKSALQDMTGHAIDKVNVYIVDMEQPQPVKE